VIGDPGADWLYDDTGTAIFAAIRATTACSAAGSRSSALKAFDGALSSVRTAVDEGFCDSA
jgi:hypothetical protein